MRRDLGFALEPEEEKDEGLLFVLLLGWSGGECGGVLGKGVEVGLGGTRVVAEEPTEEAEVVEEDVERDVPEVNESSEPDEAPRATWPMWRGFGRGSRIGAEGRRVCGTTRDAGAGGRAGVCVGVMLLDGDVSSIR